MKKHLKYTYIYIHTQVCTNTHTHTGSSSQTLRLKKASFKVELTSEKGEDVVPTLEGFPVDGSGTVFLTFLLGDPHLLKGVQGCEDRAPGTEGIQRNSMRKRERVFASCSTFPEELLTQSTWNTVSPEVQIS